MDTETHSPLSGDSHLAFLPTACLAVRGGVAACDRCAAACPVGVLKVGADGTALTGDCLHCGRCAAACPTGALVAQGFAEAKLPSGNLPVTVECWKVPRDVAGPRALRVPCLGGIPLFLLLEWLIAAQPRRLVFVDRGACAGCSAGTGGFAADAVLAALTPWLEECGLSAAQWPQRIHQPLPRSLMPKEIPSAQRELAMSRRAFFGRLGKEIARSERPAAPPAGPRAAVRRAACVQPARERFLTALEKIAAAQGRAPPAAAYPRLEVSAACRDHGLCAGVCPTGALVRIEAAGCSELKFLSAACIACRRCVEVCPEHALRLETGGKRQQVVLRSQALRVCLECGRAFAPSAGENVCPHCLAQRALAQSLFRAGTNAAGQ
jgi:ferredoxin